MQLYTDRSPALSQSVDTCSLSLRQTNSGHNNAIDIQYYNLSYVVRKGDVSKTILHPMSGVVEHGKLTVIMGPSGAGKSSLMNILSGYRSQVAGGEVCINGRLRNMRTFKSLSSYIMQQDQLHPNLTVLESMMFAAKLKLPHHISEANKYSLAMDVIESLGLGNCLHVNAGNLSGGQRKRLAIAQELISDPAVLFLDEPTSGLDSSSTYQCVKLLKYLAELGHTVICTIHQPSTKPFLLFDQLILLSKGRVLYSGPNVHLDTFFASHGFVCPSNYNRADYIIEVAIGDCGPTDPLVTSFESQSREFNSQRRLVCSNKMSRSNVDPPIEAGIGFKKSTMQHFPTSFVYQFYILLIRTTKCTLRDSSLTRLRLISHLGLAIVVGLLYLNVSSKNDSVLMNSAVQFISIMFVMYLSLMPTVLSFPLEREILVREHLNSWYRLFSYYMAKTFADTPLQIILPVMYGTIIYWMTAQSSEGYRFILYLAIYVLIGLVSQSLGLLIGAGCSMETGVFLAPVMTTPMLLFSGYFIPLNSIPGYLRWCSYFSLIRYGFLGTIQTIYGFDRGELRCANPQRCMFSTGHDVLETMDALDLGYYSNFVVLCVLCVFFRIAAFFALKLYLNRTND